MGVSKVILVDPNTQTPEVLMDVTGDDTSANVLLAGNVGTRNDGEKVTGTIPEKTSSDLTVSGATVTAPAGHYASSASATVASGTAGTPTATKGSVSNHSVNVTPSVTNTAGYISGGTQTGTPVSVSASELVSGTKSISANGTGIDVTNYATVDVDVATEMPGLENALCFSSPSSFTLQIGTNGLTAAQVWNHMEWTDAATPQSVWATWDGSTTLTATNGKLYLRGTGNTSVTGYDFMRSIFITFQFTGADIECSGNIETLLDYETVAQGNHPTMDAGCYGYLFFNSPITTAPSLPATTLTDYCYYYMFCRTALTSAPSLPATTLATSCYSNMFYGCAALTSAPSLPATTLATSCYERMFYNCTALTSAPALPTTTLSKRCYCYMFNGCTALTSAPALPATTLTTYCYSNMFHDCTALTSAPVLPATTLATYCYYSMFYGCTALTSAPELPATTLTTSCYQSMFYGCAALTSAPSLPATTLATYCYQSMFRGCTALASVPVLPATTLANYCYNNMFYGCSSIKLSTAYDPTNYPYAFRIPESGTGVDATGSFNGMFTGTGGSFADTPAINTVYYLDKPLPVDFTVDGDATASDILPGKISYANGSRVIGNMASKSSSDLTVSGATVTAPAGYYSADASKSVASGSAFAPASIGGTGATVSTDTNTMTLTKSVFVTPIVSAGYVSAGTKTNSSISLTADVTTKEAATITPTTSDQTIAAGTYLTGAQTIEGDANLTASNIKKGVSIFGITGDYEMGSNRNLLDNWYFVGGGSQQGGYQLPINQRGQTSYAWNGMQYSIDRWRFDTLAAAPLEVQSDGVNLNASALTYGSPYMRQIIDNVEFFRGKQLTFSALVTAVSGSDSKGYLRVYDGTNSAWGVYIATGAGLWSTTFTVPSNASDFVCDIGVYDGRTVKVAAAKLELGEVSTLENDAPPDYGEELSRCIYSTVDWVDTYSSTGFARSNRNLLDNGWFTVNQRGVADGTTTAGNGYFADRWQATGSGVQRVAGGGITVLGTAYHKLGNLGLAGKTVTLSILYSNGEISSNTFAWTGTQFSKTFAYGTVNIYPSANQINIGVQSVNVTAAKLEIGDISTLANDVPPNYGEELARCLNSIADESDPYANAGFGFGITNPNLLDNAYFVNPVNQRGQTAYTGGYSIDRWKLLNNSGTLNIVSGGIQFTNTTGGYGYCTQRVDNINFNTTPCTFSLLTSTGDLYTRRVSAQMFSLPSGLYFYQGASNELAIRIPTNLSAENSEIIVAMKIEIGTIQTLAHKENGVWVLNEIPHFAEELAKCQRYYWNSGFSSDHPGLFCGITNANGNGFQIIVPTPVTMRAVTPTVNASVGWVRGNGGQVTGYGLNTNATAILNGFVYGISIDKTSGFTPMQTYWAALTRLTVSCDL